MRKPDLLRAALVAGIPELALDPGNLVLFIDKGRVRAPMTAERGFAWTYDLNLIVTAYTGDPAALFFLVVDWLRVQQPALLAPGATSGFTFEVDILDPRTSDVQIVLTLDEIVTASPQEDGSIRLETVAEPDPLFAAESALGDAWSEMWTEADGKLTP